MPTPPDIVDGSTPIVPTALAPSGQLPKGQAVTSPACPKGTLSGYVRGHSMRSGPPIGGPSALCLPLRKGCGYFGGSVVAGVAFIFFFL
jgi:hypothetical protein